MLKIPNQETYEKIRKSASIISPGKKILKIYESEVLYNISFEHYIGGKLMTTGYAIKKEELENYLTN